MHSHHLSKIGSCGNSHFTPAQVPRRVFSIFFSNKCLIQKPIIFFTTGFSFVLQTPHVLRNRSRRLPRSRRHDRKRQSTKQTNQHLPQKVTQTSQKESCLHSESPVLFTVRSGPMFCVVHVRLGALIAIQDWPPPPYLFAACTAFFIHSLGSKGCFLLGRDLALPQDQTFDPLLCVTNTITFLSNTRRQHFEGQDGCFPSRVA